MGKISENVNLPGKLRLQLNLFMMETYCPAMIDFFGLIEPNYIQINLATVEY